MKAVSGREPSLSQPTRFAHPAVKVDRSTRAAEVLNLTRNVRIEGAPGGRAHIFVLSSRPQSLQNVAIRHMGPRQPADGFTEAVLGHGLHFHMSGDGSRGSVVENVVIRDTGAHAFVAHLSNGVTFRNCISHDTFDDPYWWDGAPDTRTPGPPSQDIVYDRCVASMVQSDPPFRGYRLAGFFLGRGDGNKAVGCVAVGVQGTTDAAGYIWPGGLGGDLEVRGLRGPQQRHPRDLHLANTGKLRRHSASPPTTTARPASPTAPTATPTSTRTRFSTAIGPRP